MSIHEPVEGEQSLVPASTTAPHLVEIPNAPPVRLQTLDLARHIAIAPDNKRYVVATFDDTHLGRGYVTALYPQQNGYLTLLRLVIKEIRSETLETALEQHISMVRAIQQGKLQQIVNGRQR